MHGHKASSLAGESFKANLVERNLVQVVIKLIITLLMMQSNQHN